MNRYLVLGLFALLIVAISLVRLMSDQEFFRLTAMKKAWGRTRGLAMHFLGNVGLPMVAGIIFVAYGAVDFNPSVERGAALAARLQPSQFISLVQSCSVPVPSFKELRTHELFICP